MAPNPRRNRGKNENFDVYNIGSIDQYDGVAFSNLFYESAEQQGSRKMTNQSVLFEIKKTLIFCYLGKEHYQTK